MISEPVLPKPSGRYKLYKKRWYMLFVVVMFNLSNAIVWITFAPVTNYSAEYFKVGETKINWCSLIFFVAFVPFCGLSWWILERFGFRFSIILGTFLNGLGGAIRVLGLYVTDKPSDKFIFVLAGQTLSACTQPLVLSMPTKLAGLWFGDKERTIANTIASLANPVGVAVANGVAAGLVKSSSDIKLMLIIFAVPGVVAFLLALFGFTSSKPRTPPSASALVKPISFFAGIKEVLRNKHFIILLIAAGCGIGSFSFLSSIVQQLICIKGYNDVIAGIAGAMLILGGVIGSAILGVYVDRSRKYLETSKVLIMLMGLFSCAISIISYMRNQTVLLVMSFIFYGFCGLGGLPLLLELGVECTFPVDEATSSGMIWMFGQAIGAAMMLGGLGAAKRLTPAQIAHSVCVVSSDTHPVDLVYPILTVFCICFIPGVVYIGCFTTNYRRLEAERESLRNVIGDKNSEGSSSLGDSSVDDLSDHSGDYAAKNIV